MTRDTLGGCRWGSMPHGAEGCRDVSESTKSTRRSKQIACVWRPLEAFLVRSCTPLQGMLSIMPYSSQAERYVVSTNFEECNQLFRRSRRRNLPHIDKIPQNMTLHCQYWWPERRDAIWMTCAAFLGMNVGCSDNAPFHQTVWYEHKTFFILSPGISYLVGWLHSHKIYRCNPIKHLFVETIVVEEPSPRCERKKCIILIETSDKCVSKSIKNFTATSRHCRLSTPCSCCHGSAQVSTV